MNKRTNLSYETLFEPISLSIYAKRTTEGEAATATGEQRLSLGTPSQSERNHLFNRRESPLMIIQEPYRCHSLA